MVRAVEEEKEEVLPEGCQPARSDSTNLPAISMVWFVFNAKRFLEAYLVFGIFNTLNLAFFLPIG